MASITYPVIKSEKTSRLTLDRSSGRLCKHGLYGYQWIVTKPNGDRRILSGISESLSKRLSSYISQFNKKITDDSTELHQLVRDRENRTVVQIFPYDENTDLVQAEEDLIASVSEEENLNQTKGGNGGGSWAQYGDREPSVKEFLPDTPVKYYPFRVQKKGNIAPQPTPNFRAAKSGIYVIKHVESGTQYVGTSANLLKRVRSHGSKATHNPMTKFAKALARSPEKHVFGVLPSTTKFTPLTRREAEKHYVKSRRPAYNSCAGGGGPAPMRKKLKFSSNTPSDSVEAVSESQE